MTLGQKASLLWAVGAGRYVQTCGLFMLGMLIGRRKLFISSEENSRFWIKTLIITAIAFGPLYQLKVLLMDTVLVASFVLLYQWEGFRRFTSVLRSYGKMSLTNYVSQSFFGALIYFPIGLNLAPYCGYTVSMFIGIVFFFLQVRFCKWWAERHKHGPLEGIWHKWTWVGSK